MVSGQTMDGMGPIGELRVRIERWRRSKAKRGAMPEELWAEAVALTADHGLHPVAQQLRLSYDRLKLRVVEAELARVRLRAEEQIDGEPGIEAPVEFIEIQAPRAAPERGQSGPAVTEVELARPDGSRITVRMACGQQLDLAGLSESFLGVGR